MKIGALLERCYDFGVDDVLSEHLAFDINEGLIKTYPPFDTIRYVKTHVKNISDNNICEYDIDIRVEHIASSVNPEFPPENILLTSKGKELNASDEFEFKRMFGLCGWVLSRKNMSIDRDSGDNAFDYIFEPKFNYDITEDIKNKISYLYHVSPEIYKDKILRQGFVPKSKNASFDYPDRVYLLLLTGNPINQAKNFALSLAQRVKWKEDLSSPGEYPMYVLYAIDVSKLQQGTRIYRDPISKYGVYTFSNIPPDAIAGSMNINPNEAEFPSM